MHGQSFSNNFTKAKSVILALPALLLLGALISLCPIHHEAYADATPHGWKTVHKSKVYYKHGEKVIGKQKIGKYYYFFNKKGVMQKGTKRSSGFTYYLDDKGHMEVYKYKKRFYKPTGARMMGYQAKEYQTLLNARKIVRQITKPSWPKSKKLMACFRWVMNGQYRQYRKFSNYVGWTADFANDHFVRRYKGARAGCCVSDGAAFAYLATAVGYNHMFVGVDTKSGTGGHGCARMGANRYYDPLFAQSKSFSKYYGGRNAGYFFRSSEILVPSPSNNYSTSRYYGQTPSGYKEAVKSLKRGLVKERRGYVFYEKGKKVKNKWKTVGKSLYYFKANGLAATGPARIKKKSYVFSLQGRLLRGTGTRAVKVGGSVYRVTKGGLANPGWDAGGTVLYLENGRKATGFSVYMGKGYWFGSGGKLDSGRTEKINSYAKGAEAGGLKSLLGKPISTKKSASCLPVMDVSGNLIFGDEVAYTYKNGKAVFLKADKDGKLHFLRFERVTT